MIGKIWGANCFDESTMAWLDNHSYFVVDITYYKYIFLFIFCENVLFQKRDGTNIT